MIEIIDIIQCDGGISMGLATLIAGLAAAGASTGQAIGAGKMNKRAERYAREENALNRQFQAEQSQIGRDFQEEMYNKYYSPSAMMQQFKDAGVNPVLAAGQITGQGSMSSPSPVGGSSMQPNFVNPMESFAGISDSIMNISRLKAEIRNLNADSLQKETLAKGQSITNEYSPKIFEQNLKQGELNLENTIQGINLALSKIRLNDDQLLNNVVARARDISALRKMDTETLTEYFKQGLIIAQTITETHRGKQISLDNFAKEWRNNFIRTKNVNPELAQGMWGLMTQALGTLTDTVVGVGNTISDTIHKYLGSNPFNFITGKFKPITKLISPFNPL